MSESKSILKHGSFLFIAGLFSNASNYFYHFFMTRHLSIGDYGDLYSLIALMNILGVASGSIQFVITQRISANIAREDISQARKFYWFSLRWMFIIGIISAVIYILSIPFFKAYMKIDSSLYFILVSFVFMLNFIYPVIIGTLQGSQNFMAYGINSFCLSISRLAFGFLLVYAGFGVYGALSAFSGSILVGIIIGFIMLWSFMRNSLNDNSMQDNSDNHIKYYNKILPIIIALWIYQMLCQVDIMIIKHYFSKTEVGLYSAVSLVGKVFLFIPIAFIQVMVPKVAGEHAINKETRHHLHKTVLYGFILCFIGIVLCLLFPKFILRIVSGDKYLEASYLLQFFPIAVTPLALTGVFLNYYLAKEQKRFIISFIIIFLLQVLLMQLFHGSMLHILAIMFSCGSVLFAWNYMHLNIRKNG